jgi:hypothetical protein
LHITQHLAFLAFVINIFFLLLLLFLGPANAGELPLFASERPLDVVLELPVKTLMKQSAKRPVVAGQLSYFDADGAEVAIDVKITTRGNSRLEECSFPPLSITLKKKRVKGTLFEGQKKLKVVTHCNNQSRFGQYLLQEYSIYRAFRSLTDASFRVRFLNIRYRNSEKSGRDIEKTAFLIESIDEIADRLQMKRRKIRSVSAKQLDPDYATMSALFHFLVGNTDWSMLKGPGEDRCCHNGKVLSQPGERDNWIVVPYDFDQAGLINTSYAVPAEQLPIRSVRQRLFRGRCSHADHVDAAVSLFVDRREQLESILVPDSLSRSRQKATLSYINEFYRIVTDEKKRQRYIEKTCLGG